MFCISVSYKKAPVEVRQKFAFSEEEQRTFLQQMLDEHRVDGGVIVSTCNRSELYFMGNPSEMDAIAECLKEFKQLSDDSLKKYGMFFQDKQALAHLYKVACGLDSMVLGEDEILRQIKEAYQFARENGFTNGNMNIIFQGAFNCAKLSKSSTALSNTPISIGTITANVVEQYLREHAAGGRVMVIGATGKIGSIVAKDLVSKGIEVLGTTRNSKHANNLYYRGDPRMEWMDFDKRYELLGEVDAIVSATASPHYTLVREDFLAAAGSKKPMLLIDLAVPYDIDQELGREDEVTLYNIDFFKTLSRENTNIRQGEADKAKHIVNECVEEVLKKVYVQDFQKEEAEQFKQEWFRKMIVYLRDSLDSEQLYRVLQTIDQKEKGGVSA